MVFLRRPHVLFMLQLDPTPQIKKIGDIFNMKHGLIRHCLSLRGYAYASIFFSEQYHQHYQIVTVAALLGFQVDCGFSPCS